MDLSPEMVKMCQKKGLEAKVIDIYNLSSLNRKFDAIFSLNVLLHVPKEDLDTVLTSIANTLNDKGNRDRSLFNPIALENLKNP